MNNVKIKKFNKVDSNDYWMGLTFLLAAKSANGHAAIVVENSRMIGVGIENPPLVCDFNDHYIPAELFAVNSCKKEITNATIFLTKTPNYNSAMTILSVPGLRRIVYFSTEPLNKTVGDLFSGLFGEIDEFKGNLNWIYDYMESLDL
jgi:hypothetical protein